MLLTPSPQMPRRRTQTFVTPEQFGDAPPSLSADGYDAVFALYEACREAGITATPLPRTPANCWWPPCPI